MRFLWIGVLIFISSVIGNASNIGTLLEAFESANFGPQSRQSLQVLGQSTQEFLKSPVNKDILRTPQGRFLLEKQTRLTNFLSIQSTFDRCVKADRSDRNLPERILTAAGQASVPLSCKGLCNTMQSPISNLQDFVADLNSKMVGQTPADLQNQLISQSLRNAAATYVSLLAQYKPGSVGADGVRALCRDANGKQTCDSATEAALVRYADSYLRQHPVQRVSFNQAAKEINGRIDELNAKLKSTKINVYEGWFNNWAWNSSDPSFSDENRVALNEYVNLYLKAASSGPGLLMLTSHLRDKIGGLRTEADVQEMSNTSKNTTRYRFTPHKKVSPLDVKNAEAEAEQTILEQARLLNEMNANKAIGRGSTAESLNLRNIKNLIRTNPLAVGQVLIANPEMAGLVCEAMNQVNQDDEWAKKWKTGFTVGGYVVGAALAVTGVGTAAAAAGAWLLAGTPAAATLAAGAATVGTAAAGVSAAMGLTTAGVSAAEALAARQESQSLERALISGNADGQSVLEARKAVADFESAKMQAIVSLGLSAVDVAALTSVVKAASLSAAYGAGAKANSANVGVVRSAATTLKNLVADSAVAKRLGELKQTLGGEKLGKFLGYLIQASEGERKRILQRLVQMAPEKFKKTVESALVIARDCAS